MCCSHTEHPEISRTLPVQEKILLQDRGTLLDKRAVDGKPDQSGRGDTCPHAHIWQYKMPCWCKAGLLGRTAQALSSNLVGLRCFSRSSAILRGKKMNTCSLTESPCCPPRSTWLMFHWTKVEFRSAINLGKLLFEKNLH